MDACVLLGLQRSESCGWIQRAQRTCFRARFHRSKHAWDACKARESHRLGAIVHWNRPRTDDHSDQSKINRLHASRSFRENRECNKGRKARGRDATERVHVIYERRYSKTLSRNTDWGYHSCDWNFSPCIDKNGKR